MLPDFSATAEFFHPLNLRIEFFRPLNLRKESDNTITFTKELIRIAFQFIQNSKSVRVVGSEDCDKWQPFLLTGTTARL